MPFFSLKLSNLLNNTWQLHAGSYFRATLVILVNALVMQVNDAVLAGNNLVSCSSDTTLKVLHFKKIVLIFEEMTFC